MAKPGQEEKFEIQAKARMSALVGAELSDKIAEREAAIVSRMIASYRGGKLDDRCLLGYVAEISALRGLLSEIDREAAQGFDQEEEVSQ